MILVVVGTFAENLAAKVTLVILVFVCTFTQRLATQVTLVILVVVGTLAQGFAAYITRMIVIGICTRTYHSVADIAYMVMVGVCVDVLRDRNCYVDILNRIVVCRIGRVNLALKACAPSTPMISVPSMLRLYSAEESTLPPSSTVKVGMTGVPV